jgi:hypothetical protein
MQSPVVRQHAGIADDQVIMKNIAPSAAGLSDAARMPAGVTGVARYQPIFNQSWTEPVPYRETSETYP